MQILTGSDRELSLRSGKSVHDRWHGVLFAIVALLVACVSAAPGSGETQQGSRSATDMLPDSQTALRVGTSVLTGVLGTEAVSTHAPFTALQIGESWHLSGKVLPGWTYPAIILELARSDARVVRLAYSRGPDAEPVDFSPETGFVPDAATAIGVATAVLTPVYGPGPIERQKPLLAVLTDDVWSVRGQLADGALGGVASISINQRDGRIVRMTHSR